MTARVVSEQPPFQNASLLLSGSRGIGGVTWTSSSEGLTNLELFDLEEDEYEQTEEGEGRAENDDNDDDEQLNEA